MTTYNTQNPIGSKDPRDLYDNAENLDAAVNDTSRDTWTDRLGRSRKTMSGMERQFDAAEDYREATFASTQADKQSRFDNFIASSGYQFLGDYAAGIEITEYNQIVRDANGEFWRLSGEVELPYTTTGVGLPEGDSLTPLGDAVLRQELANPDMGAAMVARGVVAVNNIADLIALPENQRKDDIRYLVKEYHEGTGVGGGEFYWDSSRTTENDGGYLLGGFIRVNTTGIVSLVEYGVIEDEDITLKIQAAVDIAAIKNIRRVEIPKGEYWINGTRKSLAGDDRNSYAIMVPSNVDIFNQATLKVIPNDSRGSAVFMFHNCRNSSIVGGFYVGDKWDHDHKGGNHEWGYCIRISGDVHNIKVRELDIQDFTGDGIYISADKNPEVLRNITVSDCHIRECRRHEITITSGSGITVKNNILTKLNPKKDGIANTTYGGLNIDVEPWFEPSTQTSNEYVSDLVFENNVFACATNACLRVSTTKVPTKNIFVLNNSFLGTELCVVDSAENVIISGNTIIHDLLGGSGVKESWGIRLTGVSNGRILNNYVKDSPRPIYVYVAPYVVKNEKITITGNVVELFEDKAYSGGIYVTEDANSVTVTDNILLHRGSVVNTSFLINSRGKGVIIANNLLSSDGSMRGVHAAGEAVISNNTIKNMQFPFLRAWTGFRGKISDNLFLGDIDEFVDPAGMVSFREGVSSVFSGNVFDIKDTFSFPYIVQFYGDTGYSKASFLNNDFSRVDKSKSNLSGADAIWFGNILSDGTVDGIPTS